MAATRWVGPPRAVDGVLFADPVATLFVELFAELFSTLSTILVADRAVVLKDGRIVESGLPQDLIRLGGAFTELFGDEALAA